MANLNKPSSSITPAGGSAGTGLDLTEHQDSQMPLGTSGGGGGGFGFSEGGDASPLMEEKPSLKVNSSAAIVGLLLICAAGALFWMRSMSSSNNSALAAPSDVESRIKNFLENADVDGSTADSERGESVINALTENRIEKAVPVNDVKSNPFILPTDTQGAGATGGPVTTKGPTEQERQRDAARKAIEDAAKQIIVNSIMSGSNPLASLNGKIVRVGDSIAVGPEKVKFTVEAIDADSVELTAGSKEFDLSMGFTVSLKR